MENKLNRYVGNFVSCLNQITEAGERMATAREAMIRRFSTGRINLWQDGFCPEGTARINGVTYWCLGEYAPTTQNVMQTLCANGSGKLLELVDTVRIGNDLALEVIPKIAEEDKFKRPEDRRILIPSRQQEFFAIDPSNLGEVDIARFLARDSDLAQDYGKLLRDNCGVKHFNFYQPSGNVNVAAGFWFPGVQHNSSSCFHGSCSELSSAIGAAYGISTTSKEASADIEEIISPEETSNIIEMLLKNRPKK
ncbi:MAG: hypothetical protein WCI72_00595 [archaeon]